MSELNSDLLPCPNPWCGNSEPVIAYSSGRMGRNSVYQFVCNACGTKGPEHATRGAAVAGWNTRCALETEEAAGPAWFDAAQPAPEGQPVIALYRSWDRPNGKLMKHVVWWREGDWRIYPFTANRGYVDRWQPLAAMVRPCEINSARR